MTRATSHTAECNLPPAFNSFQHIKLKFSVWMLTVTYSDILFSVLLPSPGTHFKNIASQRKCNYVNFQILIFSEVIPSPLLKWNTEQHSYLQGK